MTHVMLMSTDADIIGTPLNSAWDPILARYTWSQVAALNLGIPNRATIVVIAHGNGDEIGNARPGTVDISPESFLVHIQANMAQGGTPAAIYISTCAYGIAAFAAQVRIAAQNNQLWNNTRIFGHWNPVLGSVPGPNTSDWIQIFPRRRRVPAVHP
ncbi:hypothetical protein [Corallococcus exercitus]|uniref:hypothetical protein n=1 Tax=Corallococcus exercitus TaxID=2316736 RepID=UPI001ABFC07C|nr:hypothetical protein [Corallococcus exercitus]